MVGLLGAPGQMPWGLLGAGLGLMEAGAPSRTPQSAGAGLLRGVMQGQQMQGMQQQMQMDQQRMGLLQAEMDRKRQQDEARQTLLGTLPEEERVYGLLAPDVLAERKLSQIYPDAPDLPSGMRMGANGQPEWIPGYLEAQERLRRAGRASTNINVDGRQFGTIPQGYQMIQDPATGAVRMEPVPGSPAQTEAAAAAETAAANQQQTELKTDIVTEDINRVLNLVESAQLPTTGGPGSLLSRVPGTAAHDISNMLETIKASSTIDTLQQMRQASPTGGALGNVTENEGRMLAATLGSLEQSQSKEQFVYNLKRLHNLKLDIVHGSGNGPARLPLGQQSGGGGTGFTPDQVRPFTAVSPNEQSALRPFQPGEFVDNQDGSQSTERTLTVPLRDGSWANVPSLWMSPNGPVDFGRNDDAAAEQALRFEQMTGQRFPRYQSAQDGIEASKERSAGGGVFQGSATGQTKAYDQMSLDDLIMLDATTLSTEDAMAAQQALERLLGGQ